MSDCSRSSRQSGPSSAIDRRPTRPSVRSNSAMKFQITSPHARLARQRRAPRRTAGRAAPRSRRARAALNASAPPRMPLSSSDRDRARRPPRPRPAARRASRSTRPPGGRRGWRRRPRRRRASTARPRVVRVQQPLEHDRQPRLAAQPRQVVPGQRRPRVDRQKRLARRRAAGPSGGWRGQEPGAGPGRLQAATGSRRASAGPHASDGGARPQTIAGRPGRTCTARSPCRARTAGTQVEVTAAPAEHRRVEGDHDRLAAGRPRRAGRSSRRARRRSTSTAGTSAARPPSPRRTPPSTARPGWRRPSARPAAAAARATATSASRCTSSSAPTGASSSGEGSRRPNSSTDRSRSDTSRSTRGTIRPAVERRAVGAIVASSPAPPATYANASRDIRRRASRLEPREVERDGRTPPAQTGEVDVRLARASEVPADR